jgi:hypothetical protein
MKNAYVVVEFAVDNFVKRLVLTHAIQRADFLIGVC